MTTALFLENSLYKNSNPVDPRVYNFTDIRKKHSSHAITADISLVDDGVAAQFFKTDACIITGKHTGESPSAGDVQEFKASLPDMPVVLGSGISAENVKDYRDFCDVMIVGTSVKKEGKWENVVCEERSREFIKRLHE